MNSNFYDQTKRFETLEQWFYETRPYIYLAIAGIGFFNSSASQFSIACAITLLFCSAKIFDWRTGYRKNL